MLGAIRFSVRTRYHTSEHELSNFHGERKRASSNVGNFPPLPFKKLAAKKALTGGPITAAGTGGMAPGFSTQFCGVEVDPKTGKGDDIALCRHAVRRQGDLLLLRRGQIQGGVARGIGWALNEEYLQLNGWHQQPRNCHSRIVFSHYRALLSWCQIIEGGGDA
jgi:CO/xanthine dehydrogenase Mo-binding subunit